MMKTVAKGGVPNVPGMGPIPGAGFAAAARRSSQEEGLALGQPGQARGGERRARGGRQAGRRPARAAAASGSAAPRRRAARGRTHRRRAGRRCRSSSAARRPGPRASATAPGSSGASLESMTFARRPSGRRRSGGSGRAAAGPGARRAGSRRRGRCRPRPRTASSDDRVHVRHRARAAVGSPDAGDADDACLPGTPLAQLPSIRCAFAVDERRVLSRSLRVAAMRMNSGAGQRRVDLLPVVRVVPAGLHEARPGDGEVGESPVVRGRDACRPRLVGCDALAERDRVADRDGATVPAVPWRAARPGCRHRRDCGWAMGRACGAAEHPARAISGDVSAAGASTGRRRGARAASGGQTHACEARRTKLRECCVRTRGRARHEW